MRSIQEEIAITVNNKIREIEQNYNYYKAFQETTKANQVSKLIETNGVNISSAAEFFDLSIPCQETMLKMAK